MASPDSTRPGCSHSRQQLVARAHQTLARCACLLVTLAALAGSATTAAAQPSPVVTITNLPAESVLGEPVVFTVTLDNASPTDTGYGPYLDIVLPATGVDGANTEVDDGITFVGASYLGVPIDARVLTFNALGQAIHPYAKDASGQPLVITGTPGDQLVVLRLPFSSLTPGQPALPIQIIANVSPLADVGAPLTITANGGFEFGADAVDNPTTDPTIVGPPASGSTTPTILRLHKTYLGAEDETVTGPNFPVQYRIDVDIADGQTVTALDVTDVLPANLQFVAVVSTTVRGTPVVTSSLATPGTTTPGGTLTRRFSTVTGTTATNDASVLFTVYVPRTDAGSAPVLDPNSGAPNTSADDARTQGNWTPVDPRDPPGTVTSDVTTVDHLLTDKALTIRKRVAVTIDTGTPGPSPGDVLTYTLDLQLSDFFALRTLSISDLIPDGLRPDPQFVPRLRATQHGVTSNAAFAPANFTFAANTPTPGATNATFRISDEIATRGGDAVLLGGCVPAGGTGGPPPDCTANSGPTTLTVTYRLIIEQDYGGSSSAVDGGDVLPNNVTTTASIVDNATLAPTGSTATDNSGASVTIKTGELNKTLYALNGSTTLPSTVRLVPGDTVTYRLTFTLPTNNTGAVTITDFLPFPIFSASEVTAFVPTISAAPPPAGQAKFGPTETFLGLSGLVPAMTTLPNANGLRFAYPGFDDPSNVPTTIDLLLTVTATTVPAADGLPLTNLVHATAETSQGTTVTFDDVAQLTLTEPDVRVTKGVVATNATPASFAPMPVGPVAFTVPGSSGYRGSGPITSSGLAVAPVNSNLTGADAGDLVTFAIVLENTGTSAAGAFDVRVRDTLPAGFAIPSGGAGLNLQVTNGAGTPLPFTNLGGGLFDPAGGIDLTDGATGSLGATHPTNGLGIAVITYDLEVQSTAQPVQTLTNTATLFNFAGAEGAPDHTGTDRTDDATVTTAAPTVTKTLVSTNQPHTLGSRVAIGEQVTFDVIVRVPEGEADAVTLVDTLPAGLAIVSLDSLTPSSGALTSSAGSFNAVLAAATIAAVGAGAENAGRRATLDLGTLTNGDRDNGTAETLALRLTAVVINGGSNDRGDTRANGATLAFAGGSVNGTSPSVRIAEPTLGVTKTVTPATGDSGDTVTVAVTIAHAPGSDADAFNVTLDDVVPAGLTFVSVSSVTGLAPSSLTATGGFAATWTSFPLGGSATITFTATINSGIGPGQVITNTAIGRWTSLPGVVTTPQTPNNSLSTERTGNAADPGGADNDYVSTDTATVTGRSALASKTILSTSLPATTGTTVVVGERIRYQIQIVVPEVTANQATLVDTLDAGLAFISFDSLTVSSPALSTSVPGGLPAILANAAVTNVGGGPTNDGRRVTFDFGTVTNSDTDNSTAETLTLIYTAVVLNIPSNTRGAALNNEVTTAPTPPAQGISAPDVIVAEPTLQVVKSAIPTLADAGDIVTFTLTIAHTGASNAIAYEVSLLDVIPPGMTYVPGSLTEVSGLAPDVLFETAGTLTGFYQLFPLGETSVLQFKATTDTTPTPVAPGQVITNTATVNWSSLPGSVTVPLSTYNTFSVERTGDTSGPGGAANTYLTSGSQAVSIAASSIAGVVYVDITEDGTQQTFEPGIGGVALALTGTDHLGAAVSLAATTLPDGSYAFTGLRTGAYTIRETQPAGYSDGLDRVGTPPLGAVAGDDVLGVMTLPPRTNTVATGFDFGELATADLSITKTDSQDPVLPGGTFSYTLHIENKGPNTALFADMSDPLPGGTTFLAINPSSWICTTPDVGTNGTVNCWNLFMSAGETIDFTITVRVDDGVVPHALLMNTATITSFDTDPNPADNVANEPTLVAGATDADLQVTKSDAADPVEVGQTVTYTVTVRNNGPAATDATVTDTLPSGLTFGSVSSSAGSCAGSAPIVCTIPGMAAGATETITVQATAAASGVHTNNVTVAGTQPDPNPTNDAADEPTTVTAPGEADVAVVKTGPLVVSVGSNIVYTTTVTNLGTSPALAVSVADPLAAPGLTFLSNAGACTTAFPCALGTLNPGESRQIVSTFALSLAYAGPTPLVNTVTVTSTTPDPNPANNTDDVSTLVTSPDGADLAITKVDSPDAVVAGSLLVYTLVVVNNGANLAVDTVVTDELPAGLTVESTTASQGSCAGTITLRCDLGTLASGTNATIAVTVRVDSGYPTPGLLRNTARVSSAAPDPNPDNNEATQNTAVVSRTDLQIVKTGPPAATAGANAAYTLTITNAGPSDARAVVIDDPTPPGLVWVSTTGDCVTAFPCTLGPLPAGETRSIVVTFSVPSSYVLPDPIVNTATAATTTEDTNPQNNTSTTNTPLVRDADLGITKTGPPIASAGTQVAYQLTITNNGPSDAIAVQVADPAPAGLTFVSNSGDCTTPFPCTFATLPIGQSRTIVSTFQLASGYTAPDPILNTATVSSATPDAQQGNNSATASTALGAPSADLAVTKVGQAFVVPGGSATYTIVVTNNGPADAANLSLADPTPPGLTFVSNTGDCTTPFPCALGTMTAGSSRTITATFAVPASYVTPDPVVNVATVGSTTADPDPANNTATATTRVTLADVSIVKLGPSIAPRGQVLSYSVTVTNAGPTAATDVLVTDPTPTGLVFVSASAPCGGGFPCALGTMAVGATVSMTVRMRVPNDYAGPSPIQNTASVSSSIVDPDLTNNSSSSSAPLIEVADIEVTKTVDRAVPAVGEEVTFTVTTRNLGPSAATGVAVTDALPPGVALIAGTPSQGAFDAASGLWTIGAMANGGSATLALRVRVTAPGDQTNLATKTAGDQLDPDLGNNSGAASLTAFPVADIRINKTADVTNASVTFPVTFTITATNAGPSPANGVEVTDLLPPGLAFVSATPSAGAYDPATGLWTIGSLALNAKATLTITATIQQVGPMLNTARKTAETEPDPNPTNDQAGVVVNGLAADLQVVKTVSAPPLLTVGQPLTFFVTVTNNGPGIATGVRIAEAVPDGVVLDSATTSRGTYVPATGIWDIGTLDIVGPGATATLELHVTTAALTRIVNRASVSTSDQPDPNPLNNESTALAAPDVIDLADSIRAGSDPGIVGTTVDFLVDVTNVGATTNVAPITVAVPMPDEYSYVASAGARDAAVAAPADGWACTKVGRTVFCRTDASLAPDRVVTAGVRATVNAALPWGRALFAHLTTPPDFISRNNVTQLYLGPPPAPDPDMGVDQAVTVSGTGTTRTLTYAIRVDNHGPQEALNGVLTDVVPPNATLVSATGPAGACDTSGVYVSCELGSILPGHSVNVTVVLTATAPNVVIHTVSTSSDQFDMYPRDNQSVLLQALTMAAEMDTDGDGMPDAWESLMGLSVSTADAGGDPDGDGVSNIDEYRRGTHPRGFYKQYFAEGVSSDFFSSSFGTLNLSASQSAGVLFEYMLEGGQLVSDPHRIAAQQRLTLDPYGLLGSVNRAYSALVESDQPIASDRTVSWGTPSYGAHAEAGLASASTSWFFAEGATGPFELFYLLQNPNDAAAHADVTFLLTQGAPVTQPVTIPPFARYTLHVNEIPALATGSMSTRVTSDLPIVAERAMYFGTSFLGGTDGAGASALSTDWFFAEGATGAFFEEFVLIANPGLTAADVEATFARPDGQTVTRTYSVAPQSRFTILVDAVDPLLAATPVAVTLHSTNAVPVVAERAMYWPDGGWQEGHVSLGATATGVEWAVPTGTVGGPQAASTYVLIANASASSGSALVTVIFDNGERVMQTVPLGPHARYTVDVGATFTTSAGRAFSVLVTSIGTTPVPIVVESARYWSTPDVFWASGTSELATRVR